MPGFGYHSQIWVVSELSGLAGSNKGEKRETARSPGYLYLVTKIIDKFGLQTDTDSLL